MKQDKKDSAKETGIKAVAIGLLTAGVSWLNTEPIDAGIAIVFGAGLLYISANYRNIKTTVSEEEAENMVQKLSERAQKEYKKW